MNVPKDMIQAILDKILKIQDYLGDWWVGKFTRKKCMSGLFTPCKEIEIIKYRHYVFDGEVKVLAGGRIFIKTWHRSAYLCYRLTLKLPG